MIRSRSARTNMNGGDYDEAADLVAGLINDKEFESDRQLSDWLAENYPERSQNGWRCFISRFRVKHKVIVGDKGYKTCDTYYVKENDTYITYLASAKHNVVVPGPIHRAMKQEYSKLVGDGETSSTISMMYGFPETWFDEYRRKHGWLHSMLPYTDEELQERDVDDLVDDLVAKNRKLVQEKYVAERRKQVEEDAEKWRLLEDGLFSHITFSEAPKTIKRKALKPSPSDRPYALIVSPTDFHWGKYGWEDEVGEQYGFSEAKGRLYEKTARLMGMLPHSPEKIIVAVGSDWFHIDNDSGTTTKGTPQDMAGSPAEILMSGFELAKEHLELLRDIAPLEVVCIGGNHDRHTSLALMLYLKATFDNCDDVEIIVNPNLRQYVKYGDSLLGFTHGDKSTAKLPELMAVEQRKEWGEHRYHLWFHGHLHFRKSEEKGGTTVIQMPSLSGSDRYHHRHGYVSSEAGLSAYIIDHEEGLISSLFAPVA